MHKQHCLLHTLVEWRNEEQVACCYQCTFSRVNHDCSTKYTRTIKVFNDKGQLHPTVFVRFCECEPSAATLIRYGLWPCSAQKPYTAISLTFMDMVYCMMMEGKVALKTVCHAVGNHNCLSQNEVRLLYRRIVGECLEQYRHFRLDSKSRRR
ncbi:uncharacterized protein LOC105437623 [Strongylocentrotus purpuratus]|uniref:CxC1-like cysteine cluster associated with KDZ transposases domain-containing protein n=1 Tax=Strongylocentrotus purpuratus TaxID=7668 RepID=A0A7M7HJJ9_STRPU|nr:uncharacterized protein LOC105437623 [Strongylocentrotus purpuratus]|eukprot:XP_011662732.1 PREDICTED: uncharacterized protein LOC105437623 [Strongylocentrotus purpuratus]